MHKGIEVINCKNLIVYNISLISYAYFFQSHFQEEEIVINAAKARVDELWNEFQIPLWVTEFTWSRGPKWSPGRVDDPEHQIHAQQLENYYR